MPNDLSSLNYFNPNSLKQKVYYQTLAEYPQKFFAIINNAKSESDLKALDSELHLNVTDGFNKFQQYEQVVERLTGKNNE